MFISGELVLNATAMDQSAMEVVGALIMGSPGPTAEVLGFQHVFDVIPWLWKWFPY